MARYVSFTHANGLRIWVNPEHVTYVLENAATTNGTAADTITVGLLNLDDPMPLRGTVLYVVTELRKIR